MKRLPPRQMLLVGLLGLSLAATAWVAVHDEPQAEPAVPRRKATPAPATTRVDWPGPISAPRAPWPEADAVAYRAWGDAPAPPVAAPAPPLQEALDAASEEPPAPPFPYRLVGRLTDSQPRAVLDSAQRSLVLGVNDVVDGQWRIEGIDASGLRVRRLPHGPSQLIAFSPS